MVSLEFDTIREILGRVDGITLANAGCVCSDFWSVVKDESLWEKACCSLWPSSGEKDVKELISSSLGGFRKFYANCFPLFIYESGNRDSNCRDLHTALPSDFVSVVDVQYLNMPIYSKVVWGIPGADDFEGWFYDYPFRIDLINYSDMEDYDDHTAGAGLPSISITGEKHLKDGKFWGQLMGNIRLSWIMINKRTGHVANLSSWSPWAGRRNLGSNKEFELRFGCILPAHSIAPCKAVHCSIGMMFRTGDSDPAILKITEISMHLEDMRRAHLRGRNSLVVLDHALGCCRRSNDGNLVLESYQKFLVEANELREAKRIRESRLEMLVAVTGIVAFASFSYTFFRGSGLF